MSHWILNQQNRIAFVMVDNTSTEVSGLGNGFTLEISKNGAAFVASAGTKAEIANGWYTYLSTAAEANSIGVVAIKVTGAGAVQQNLVYTVQQMTSQCINYTYTVTSSGNPLANVEVFVTTDNAGNNVVWRGLTDSFGIARDENDNLPCLDAGTYFFWKELAGFSDNDNPDQEIVS